MTNKLGRILFNLYLSMAMFILYFVTFLFFLSEKDYIILTCVMGTGSILCIFIIGYNIKSLKNKLRENQSPKMDKLKLWEKEWEKDYGK